jgi:hypothetical protein
MSLRYPASAAGSADYVAFQHTKYDRGQSNSGGEGIVLYMPAPAPAVSNANSWIGSQDQFIGPIGDLKKKFARGAANMMNDDFNLATLKKHAEAFGEELKGTKVGPVARHAGNNMVAGELGLSANQMLAVTRGEIYNPNLEMFYSGPRLRSFSFEFKCTPKSSDDAQAIRKIIMEFKKWSAPQESGNKYKLPHVWNINYGGKAKSYYNKFKPAALTNISVSYNAGLDGHMTFIDGSPIVTGFSLSFLETQLITRKDAGRY